VYALARYAELMRHRRKGALLVKATPLALALLLALAAGACGFDGVASFAPGSGALPDGAGGDEASVGESGSPKDGEPATDGGPSDGASDDVADVIVDANEGGAVVPPYVYAHSPDELYRLDPATKAFADIGPLTGCNALSDIAVDSAGKIVGVGDKLYAISETTGACSTIANLAKTVATLSFASSGTVPPSDVLVAYVGSSYYSVSRTTGLLTLITFDALDPYIPSGDLVSVAGGGTYVSVTGASLGSGTDCSTTDCIFQVDPADGTIVKKLTTNIVGIYGLAEWGGKLYAFTGAGETYEIALGATLTATLVPNPAKPTDGFIGAGSSTLAPH
jgi:hypothetical protein